MRYSVTPDRRVTEAPLNPSYEYLRVRVNGRLSLLVLGSEDLRRDGARLSVFFSGEGETLKLSNGRILEFSSPGRSFQIWPATEGLSEWPLGGENYYQRLVDYQSAQALSRHQGVRLRQLSTPPKKIFLSNLDPGTLVWFEETFESLNSVESPLPRSIYAIQMSGPHAGVVYSEQCLSKSLCLKIQRWRASGAY